MRHGKGRIVWISSVAGLVKVPFDGAYAASKHAVEGICSVMHEELKPYGVEVVTVNPGAYGTGFNDTGMESMDQWWSQGERLVAHWPVRELDRQYDPAEVIAAMIEVIEAEAPPYHTLIPAEGTVSMPGTALNNEFGGRLRVRGMAQIPIHVVAEVWIASAATGAAGMLHTGWSWEMKVDNEKKRKNRYYFEGLIARATGYARVGVKSQTSRGPASTRNEHGSSSRKVTATQQGPQVSAGDPNWRDPNAERSPLDNGGTKYVLMEPTVPRVTGTAPAWQGY
ncbi:SDR family NAD(P)-dependent oxidoreductase [Paracoccus pantotrophus]|uniref:SDR family NAD(P)-dependent oxidoreductase n=1 Tax=Paracoccus pantotrophus TaxID=82367 RepID=UPI0035B40928